MTIPVILLNYNSSTDCHKCIFFLKKQEGIQIEIVVVDNCSVEADLQNLRTLCSEQGCTLLENKENRGYNAGNNIGLRYAAKKGYEYALIANPDIEFPQTDYLVRMVERMRQDKQIVVCGSDIVTPDGVHQNPMRREGHWSSSWNWVTVPFKKKKTDTYDFIDNYRESHFCSKVSGCCLIVRMDFMQSISFFDENVFLYCEEAILAKQVERVGKKIYYLADIQAVHRHIKSEKGDPIKRYKNWEKARIYFIKRYSGFSVLGRCMAILSIQTYIALLIFHYKSAHR